MNKKYLSESTLAQRVRRLRSAIYKFSKTGSIAIFFIAGMWEDLPEPTQINNAAREDKYFHMVVLPDTQYYTDPDSKGGTMDMFRDQIDWIIGNQTAANVKYVAHVGDITDNGDRPGHEYEWINAKSQLYRLDTANVAYGLAVGNHDQWCHGNPGDGTTDNFNKWFGKDHFKDRPWYGGAYGSGNNNDNHYDIFTEHGVKFLVMYIEFNQKGYAPRTGDCAGQQHYSENIESAVKDWANGIIRSKPDHKVIIVSHSILKPHTTPDTEHNLSHTSQSGQARENLPASFTPQGTFLYENIAKPNKNVFMMLGGHITGEGYREENQNGHTVKAFVSDFQGREKGGNGYMRLLKFNLTTNTLDIRTIRPFAGGMEEEQDADSKFSVSLF